jgi:hypothetical protein
LETGRPGVARSPSPSPMSVPAFQLPRRLACVRHVAHGHADCRVPANCHKAPTAVPLPEPGTLIPHRTETS